MKVAAKIITWLSLPLFIPVVALLMVLYAPVNPLDFSELVLFQIPQKVKAILLLIFTLFYIVAPGISFLGLQRMKVISTVEMEERKERNLPLVIMLLYGTMLFFLLRQSDPQNLLPEAIYAIVVSGVCLNFTALIVNYWFKISLHTAGTGFLFGFVFWFSQQHAPPLIYTLETILFCAFLVFSARWMVGKHSVLELVSGFLIASTQTWFICHIFYG